MSQDHHDSPAARPLDERLEALIQAGVVCWDGRKLARIAPVAQVAEGRSVAELLLRDREIETLGTPDGDVLPS